MDRSKKQRLLLILGVTSGLSLLVIVFWNLRPESTITSPSEYPEANLRVDVTVGSPLVQGTQQTFKEGFVISAAILGCPVFDIVSEESLPLWLRKRIGWCDAKAINLPVETNIHGEAVIWFKVTPPPHMAGIGNVDYPTPILNLGDSSKRRVHTEMPEIITPDHWRVRGTLR